MGFKFEKLEVWQLSLEYVDLAYEVAAKLPSEEKFNLSSQLRKVATSISLNIAEGSTGQTDAEQARLLGLALRSLVETVACMHIIHRRNYFDDPTVLRELYHQADKLAAKLQKFRNTVSPAQNWMRETATIYAEGNSTPSF